MASPRPTRVVPLLVDAGAVVGHRLVLLSLEIYEGWMDLRFARIDEEQQRPLPRRVPPPTAWDVQGQAGGYTVEDAVGRGDRSFSNGEVRLTPPVSTAGDLLTVQAPLLDGAPPLKAEVRVPAAEAST